MRVLFIVQGEGRGHMTQAISLSEMLKRNGHKVVQVMVGKSRHRQIPQFFYERINAPVELFESPNFSMDSKNKGIHIFPTIVYNTQRLPVFIKSLRLISKKVKEHKPDLIINFYDLLGGLYYMLYNPRIPYLLLGHQFLLQHPDFVFPKGKKTDKVLLNINTWFTSMHCDLKLALSFSKMRDIPRKKIVVVPPLLRHEVLGIEPQNKGYILGYMLNSGYSEEIIAWHREHPEVELHFFWDKADVPDDYEESPNLTFHRISDIKFLKYMQSCAGFASTSGFESVCEAFYLKKPILLIPTANHFEQQCNSLDAERVGAGIADTRFNLSKLLEFIPRYASHDNTYVNWVQSAEKIFLENIENLVKQS